MTWKMAAVAGLDPLPLTFSELRDAYNTKCDHDWSQTASLMALIANRHRTQRERPYRPENFYRPKIPQKRPRRMPDVGSLRAMFTKPA